MQYKDLLVYQNSYKLALAIHKIVVKLPSDIKFDTGDQIKRASKSIPSNIAEGFGRQKNPKEYVRFLDMARSSCDEVRVHLDFLRDLGCMNSKNHQWFYEKYNLVGRQFTALIQKWAKFS